MQKNPLLGSVPDSCKEMNFQCCAPALTMHSSPRIHRPDTAPRSVDEKAPEGCITCNALRARWIQSVKLRFASDDQGECEDGRDELQNTGRSQTPSGANASIEVDTNISKTMRYFPRLPTELASIRILHMSCEDEGNLLIIPAHLWLQALCTPRTCVLCLIPLFYYCFLPSSFHDCKKLYRPYLLGYILFLYQHCGKSVCALA
jgi:hypothetical protein